MISASFFPYCLPLPADVEGLQTFFVASSKTVSGVQNATPSA
jgi:hypothetical protein